LVYKGLARATELRMLPDLKTEETTSSISTIIFDGKEARRDVRRKLEEITEIMKIQSGLYPIFRRENIFAYMKIVLGNADDRTKKKYFDCITSYSVIKRQNVTYDVSGFCNKFQTVTF